MTGVAKQQPFSCFYWSLLLGLKQHRGDSINRPDVCLFSSEGNAPVGVRSQSKVADLSAGYQLMSVLKLWSTSGSTAASNNAVWSSILPADFCFVLFLVFFGLGAEGFFSDLDLSLRLSGVALPRDDLLSTSSALMLAHNGGNWQPCGASVLDIWQCETEVKYELD